MSADFNTFITMIGKEEELLSMISVLKTFETDKLEQYKKEHNCGYIEWVSLNNGEGKEYDLKNAPQDVLSDLIKSGEIMVKASGPYGSFGSPEDVELFEALADAAPNAYFDGEINGFNPGGEYNCSARLTEGKLLLGTRFSDFEDEPEEDEFFDYDIDFEKYYDPLTHKYHKIKKTKA